MTNSTPYRSVVPVQRSANDDQNAQSSADIQDNASTSQTCSPLKDNIRDVNIQDAHAGQGLPSVSTGQSPQTENTIAGSGDELPSQSNGDSMKFNIMAHTLLSRISQQNETQNTSLSNMLKECLTGVTSIVRENSASMNECMKSIANMVQESNLQLCNLVKENRLQLSNLSERLDTVRNPQASVLRETTRGTTNNFQSHEVTSQTPCLTLPSVVSAISTNYTAAFSTVQNRPTVSNPVATAHSDCHPSVVRSSQSCISVPTHSHNSVHSMNDSGTKLHQAAEMLNFQPSREIPKIAGRFGFLASLRWPILTNGTKLPGLASLCKDYRAQLQNSFLMKYPRTALTVFIALLRN